MEKYWKKKAKKEEKKNAKAGLSKSGEASQGQMFGAIVKAVNKIANAVSFFFTGPGLGIALAIGLVPPILILCAALVVVAYLICTTLETLLTPIINLVCDLIHWLMNELGEPIKTVLNAIAGFLETVLGKLSEVANVVIEVVVDILRPIKKVIVDVFETLGIISGFIKKIVGSFLGGVLNVGAKVAGKIFGGNKEEKPPEEEDPTKIFVKMGNAIVELKDYLTGGALTNAISDALSGFTETFTASLSTVSDTISSAFDNFATSIQTILTNAGTAIMTVMNSLFNHLFGMLNTINSTILVSAAASIGNIFQTASSMFTSMKMKLKTAMGMEVTEEEKKKAEAQANPFSMLIEGFERMHKESIAILGEIKTSLLNIEKTKIQIGSMLNSTNTGDISDGKKMNSLQPITITNETNVDDIINEIKTTNKILGDILEKNPLDRISETQIPTWGI